MLFDLLLEAKNIDVDQTTNEDDTPLCFAMKTEPFNEYFASKLLAKGAMPNPTYNATGDTLLHILTRECREGAALFLVEYCNNNLTKTNNEGFTILHEACRVGLKDLTRALLRNGQTLSDRLYVFFFLFSTGYRYR